MGLGKDLQDIVEKAQDQGWKVTMTRSGHLRFKPPSKRKRLVFTGSTPSDHRSLKNLKSTLRRQGLRL